VDLKDILSKQDAICLIGPILINNRPVLVQLNSAFLDYHSIFTSNKGRKHFIVAYGFDKEDSKFYISVCVNFEIIGDDKFATSDLAGKLLNGNVSLNANC
jgi:hypothetical protein